MPFFLSSTAQVVAGHEFHDEVMNAFVLVNLQKIGDKGTVHLGQQPGFFLKTPQRMRVLHQVGPQDLDRHDGFVRRIFGAIDDPHAALPQFLEQAIPAQSLPHDSILVRHRQTWLRTPGLHALSLFRGLPVQVQDGGQSPFDFLGRWPFRWLGGEALQDELFDGGIQALMARNAQTLVAQRRARPAPRRRRTSCEQPKSTAPSP